MAPSNTGHHVVRDYTRQLTVVAIPADINRTVRRKTLIKEFLRSEGLENIRQCDRVACLALAFSNQGAELTTIEGPGKDGNLHPMHAAFAEHDSFQCGQAPSLRG
jgi:hypothetical protein